MLARVSLWVALLSTAALLLSPASCAEDAARIEVVGTLIKPPCTANFPASQSVDIPQDKPQLAELGHHRLDRCQPGLPMHQGQPGTPAFQRRQWCF